MHDPKLLPCIINARMLPALNLEHITMIIWNKLRMIICYENITVPKKREWKKGSVFKEKWVNQFFILLRFKLV